MRVGPGSKDLLPVIAAVFVAGAAVGTLLSPGRLTAKEVRSELRIRVGEKAPDFTLTASDGEEIQLSDFTGQIVLVNFYRAHW